MTDITYDKVAAAAVAGAAEKNARKGFWQRAFDAMVEARMRQAERMLRNHGWTKQP